ncbi:MAG: pseudouridine synthase [Gammaproteobacteria bacterium]|nr:pseudouridine synthase [Gammaproteobacteria bacterium]
MPLLLLNKPFRVLCQFRDAGDRSTLADYIDRPGVYPAGRLDYDSEGLLLLTDDGRLQAQIASPAAGLVKRYWAQVEGDADPAALARLTEGVELKDGGARAVVARRIGEPAGLWARVPAIRERRAIPTSWLDIGIAEGRNRQVRRMTAAVGLPTLRLIRHRVGPWTLVGLRPGETREISTRAAWRQLGAA